MRRQTKVNHKSPRGRQRRALKALERKSYSIDAFDKKLQPLLTQAADGDYQAQLRLEAISKLLNPCLHFYETDVQRILNKGFPIQVERGLALYRMMSRLLILLEPTGTKTGVACNVRLINFEQLSVDGLLDLKGHALHLVHRVGGKLRQEDQFSGLDLLSSEERDLYQRVKPYFGGRKRPTLKRLAIGLLGESDEVYSERNAANYLAAVKDFHNTHRNNLGFGWYFVRGVESFGRDRETGRELVRRLRQQFMSDSLRQIMPSVMAEMEKTRERLAAFAKMAQGAAVSAFMANAENIARVSEAMSRSAALQQQVIMAGKPIIDSIAVTQQQFAKAAANLQSLIPKVDVPALQKAISEVCGPPLTLK